ncbi:MAG: hypothetical protein JET69_05570 [Methanomassiliicoccales archaeon]|nr:hypothetical protein [Methanomassiliicoccales archaeon]
MAERGSVPRTILDISNMPTIILYIHEKGEIVGTDLKNIVNNYPRMTKLADLLVSLDLATKKIEMKPMKTVTYSLTKKGEAVARHLRAAANILGHYAEEE